MVGKKFVSQGRKHSGTIRRTNAENARQTLSPKRQILEQNY